MQFYASSRLMAVLDGWDVSQSVRNALVASSSSLPRRREWRCAVDARVAPSGQQEREREREREKDVQQSRSLA